MISPLFDKPMWKWAQDTEKREYAGLSNVVQVCPGRGGEEHYYEVLVVVPTELFTLLKALGIRDIAKCELWLEQQKGKWFFTIDTEIGFLDLWYYTPSTRPLWSMKHNAI